MNKDTIISGTIVFVGPKNADYFAHAFRRFAAGSKVAWNWPAFFATWSWLMYRKMWLYSLVYVISVPVLFAILLFVSFNFVGGPSVLACCLTYCVVAFVLAPMFATRLYYTHAGKKINEIKSRTASIEEQRLEVARAGGVSAASTTAAVLWPSMGCIFLGVLALLVASQCRMTVRAQVSEGLNLAGGVKASVAEHYQLTGQLPSDNAAAGVSPATDIRGKYVSSVRIEAGDIFITFGNEADSDISGHSIVLRPVVSDDAVSFECSGIGIEVRHLPAACR